MNIEKNRRGGANGGVAKSGGDGFFDRLVLNTMMRLVGMLVRSAVLAVGLAVIVGEFFLGIFCIFVWIVLPVVLAAGFAQGIRLIFS